MTVEIRAITRFKKSVGDREKKAGGKKKFKGSGRIEGDNPTRS